jgi:threonine dehydratase
VDTIVVPIGGGGLVGGIGAALAETRPDVRIVGVQADDAATVPNSFDEGRPVPADDVDTIADGIATGATGRLTFPLIEEHVDEVVTVTEGEIASAIVFLLERAKQLTEERARRRSRCCSAGGSTWPVRRSFRCSRAEISTCPCSGRSSRTSSRRVDS